MPSWPGEKREILRQTFDAAAESYHAARPEYPPELFDELVRLAGIQGGDRLLEVGGGTGKATLPLAEQGFRIVALEPGAALAEQARRNLAAFDAVRVVEAAFETWQPEGAKFDVVYAATAWHWIEAEAGYRKAWQVLRRGGYLAVWSAGHVLPDGGDPFFREIQPVYDEIGEGLPPDAPWPRPGEQAGHRAEIEASGLFTVVGVRHFDWAIQYDADGYIALLNTFSGHIAMQDWQRERLYGEIRRRLSERPDGTLHRHWGAVLEVAKRID